MNTDKFAINWKNFAWVRLQLKFALIIRPKYSAQEHFLFSYTTKRLLQQNDLLQGGENMLW